MRIATRNRRRRAMLLGCAGLHFMAGGPAWAQQADVPDEGEILVTAQRRPVRAQDVAGAIAVASAETLDVTSTRTFEDIARLDTGVQLSAYQGEMQLFVRGLGSVTFIGGFDSSVAVYANGVYLSRSGVAAPAFFDLDRVEILKGPQGSLYGRNATGGAILLVNRAPSDHWTGEGRVRLGNYDTIDAFGAVSGPIAPDLNFRLAVGTANHGGFTRLDFGPVAGVGRRIERAEDRHDITGRLTLDWRPSDHAGIELTGDYYKADDRSVLFHFAGPGYANNPLFLAHIGLGELGPYGRRTVNASLLPYNRPETWGVTGRAWFDLPFGTLTSLSAYRWTNPYNFNDMSNSTELGETQFKEERAKQVSQELTLASRPGAALSYVAGVSYFRERNAIRNEFFFPFLLDYMGGAGTADCCTLRANGTTRTDAFAVFGEATVPLASRLDAVVGARWSSERRGGSNLLEFSGVQTVNDTVLTPATFRAFTPKLGLQYRLSTGAQAYATVSKGFKSGGFNTGSGQNTPYNPEKIWSYEIGADVELPDAGLRLKAAAFHYDYTDLQVQDVVTNSVVVRNAATAKVDGAELTTRWSPNRDWMLEAAGTYLDARFARYQTVNLKIPALGVLDLRGNPLPQAAKFKGRVSGEYGFDLGKRLRATARIDALWQDRIYFSAFRDPLASQRGFAWLKARVAVATADGRYEVAAYVDNLTDAWVFSNISITGDLDASRASGVLAPPRTYGVQLSGHF